jgi:DNA-directed RNA polymerase alpha subunit
MDRSERDKKMLANPTDAERIADLLERLVIAAEQIAANVCTVTPVQPRPAHVFKPHPDLQWLCITCGGSQEEDCHQLPPIGQSSPILDCPIDALYIRLSTRACNCLRLSGVETVRQLTEKTEAELLRMPGIGRRVSIEIMGFLKKEGLTLKHQGTA